MKQLKIKVTESNGKDWGYKNVMSMNWYKDGKLNMVSVDFMNSGKSSEYSIFYNYEGTLRNNHGNLSGEIFYNK
tara:strand:+ start:677 stop:898 length:222 start_codon:yes stop_codon:yes gene_type:complete